MVSSPLGPTLIQVPSAEYLEGLVEVDGGHQVAEDDKEGGDRSKIKKTSNDQGQEEGRVVCNRRDNLGGRSLS